MDDKNLERLLKDRLLHIGKDEQAEEQNEERALEKLGEDITAKLKNRTFADIAINTNVPYRIAKRNFRKKYIAKILRLKLGNIAEAARTLDTNRKTIHRMITGLRIDVNRIKDELLRPYDLELSSTSSIMEEIIKTYKKVISDHKLKEIYKNIPSVSEDILTSIPSQFPTLKQAEIEFDRIYFGALKKDCRNIREVAKRADLAYETANRKIKRQIR